MTVRILFGIVALAAAVLLGFFLLGLADGTVSGGNIRIWAVVLAVPALVLGAAAALRARGRGRLAGLLLSLLAVPAVLLGLAMGVLALSEVHWR